MRKILSLALVLVMIFSLTISVAAADEDLLISPKPEAKENIVILHTNDVHGGYRDKIGYAGLAAYKAEMEKDNYVVTVDAGDFSQGAAIAILSKGSYLIDIMNQVGYDIVVPGNHEFDYGFEQAMTNLKALEATVLSCNFKEIATGKTLFDAYKLMSFGDKTVAFVGVSTPETYTKSTPAYFMDAEGKLIYSFSQGDDFYATIQAAIDAAKAEGADYVIGVGHLGVDPQSSPWMSKEVIANTTGFDAFIDGHSHSELDNQTVTDKAGKEVVLAQTGTKLSNIGKLVIAADGTITAGLVADYEAKDEALEKYINEEIEAKYSAYTATVVAKSEVELDGEKANVRTKETNMGDLIADAYRIVMDADIGLMNGGGIRATIKAGEVKIDDILAVMTFGNMATVKMVTGQQIKDCLEMGVSAYPTASGGFTHVSGMTYSIDPSIPSSVVKDEINNFSSVSGEYRVYDIMVNGEPLQLDKVYSVACHSYWLSQYGDGMTMFEAGEIVSEKDEIYVDNAMLLKYIQENLGGVIGSEYAEPQGRITVQERKVEEPETPEVPETPVKPGDSETYVVVSGDCLWNLAYRFYGDGALFGRISSANGIPFPYAIYIGQILNIPTTK